MQHKIYFTPGPSQIYYTLNDHMREAFQKDVMCISHRGAAFQEIFANTRAGLKTLLNLPDGYDIYFLSSANEIWERIIQNLVAYKSHHFVNGSFSKKFFQFAQDYQKQSTCMKVSSGGEFDDLNIPDDAELISVTLNETSIGYSWDTKRIYALREAHPDKLIAVDGVSAFPAVDFDFSKVDTAYFSVQKCFGLPAGLGVWIVNQKCYEKAEMLKKNGFVTGSYHNLLELKAQGDNNQTPETPNTLGIFLLGKVVEDMLSKSAKMIQNDTIYKSTLLYQALEASKTLKPFITNKANRSKTVIVANCTNGNKDFIKAAAEQGWIIGKGYGEFKDSQIRIASFPVHSKEQIEQLCDLIGNF